MSDHDTLVLPVLQMIGTRSWWPASPWPTCRTRRWSSASRTLRWNCWSGCSHPPLPCSQFLLQPQATVEIACEGWAKSKRWKQERFQKQKQFFFLEPERIRLKSKRLGFFLQNDRKFSGQHYVLLGIFRCYSRLPVWGVNTPPFRRKFGPLWKIF